MLSMVIQANFPQHARLATPAIEMSKKVFVVTGANKGIGKEVARRLLEQVPGCHVVCTSSNN